MNLELRPLRQSCRTLAWKTQRTVSRAAGLLLRPGGGREGRRMMVHRHRPAGVLSAWTGFLNFGLNRLKEPVEKDQREALAYDCSVARRPGREESGILHAA